MLSEVALRSPRFDELGSVPVKLADGQMWFLPKPWIDLFPVAVNGKVSVGSSGIDFDEHLQKLRDPQDTRTFAGTLFGLAIDMLRRNYYISDDDLRQLIRYQPRDESNRTMWDAIIKVAAGSTEDLPKPTPFTTVSP